MITWVQLAATVFGAVLASSGFWAYMDRRSNKKNAQTEMLLGLGHDRIMSLGNEYVKRGNITSDEYENLDKYLYKPYKKLGGNGSAERMMRQVEALPPKEVRRDNR